MMAGVFASSKSSGLRSQITSVATSYATMNGFTQNGTHGEDYTDF